MIQQIPAKLCVAGALALFLYGCAATPPPPQNLPMKAAPVASLPYDDALQIKGPLFAHQPSGNDMAETYPTIALRLLKNGSATIRCGVSDQGRLIACTVLDETPPHYGFGDAALRLAGKFTLKRFDRTGAPVAGRIFKTRISWTLAS